MAVVTSPYRKEASKADQMNDVLRMLFSDANVWVEPTPQIDPLDPDDVKAIVSFRLKLPAPKHLPSAQSTAVDLIYKTVWEQLRTLCWRLVTKHEFDAIAVQEKGKLVEKLRRLAELTVPTDSARAFVILQMSLWLDDGSIDTAIENLEKKIR